VKVNIDGAARGCLGFPACACIFRGSNGEYIGSFSSFLGLKKSLYTEVMGVTLAIKLVWSKNFTRIWLECDSPCFVKHLVRLIFLNL